jgi:hypothetical protein
MLKNICCCALLALAAASAGSPTLRASGDLPTLTGTWRVTAMLVDCTTGAERPPFHSLLTFGSDGTLTGTTDNAAFKPGQRSPDHGVWKRTQGTSFHASSEAFILFSSAASIAPPAPAFARGVQRITQDIDIDPRTPDVFNTTASVEFFDEAGTVLMTGCAVATGTRFE